MSSATARIPNPPETGATTPTWTGGMKDLRREHGYERLQIEGKLPEALAGTLYRNGPCVFTAPDGKGKRQPIQHWFDGIGAISSVRFADGEAFGAVRQVRPKSLESEERNGKIKNWGFRTPPHGMLRRLVRKSRNSANTNLLEHNGRLFALYEANLPTEISPADLTSIGETTLDGVIPHCLSAHPHRVHAHKTTYNFGVRWALKPMLDIFAFPDQGPARRITTIPLDGIPLLHDCIATNRYLIFLVPPVRLDRLAQLTGRRTPADNLFWRPELGTEVIMVSLDNPDQVTRFTIDPFWVWHTTNAWDEGEQVVVELVRYEDSDNLTWLDGILAHQPDRAAKGFPWRLTIDPTTQKVENEPLSSVRCEFPRIAPSFEGERHQHTWLAAHSTKEAAALGLQDRVLALDTVNRREVLIDLGPDTFPSEPIAVARPGATAENDAWLLTMVYDARVDASHIAVLDADRPEHEPIARVWFDQPIPYTFHGIWVS